MSSAGSNPSSLGQSGSEPRHWHVLSAAEQVLPHEQFERESALLQAAAAGELTPQALLWSSGRALITSPADRRLPHFEAAARHAAAAGWPVSGRQTGGTAVALSPGIVNMSLVLAWQGAHPGLETGYRMLCEPLLQVLERFGIAGDVGPVAHSLCDGRYNVRVAGRKLAGTSQRQASRVGHGAMLLHAGVLVEGDAAQLTAVVAEFYCRAGDPRDYRPQSLIALQDCVAADASRSGSLTEDFSRELAAVLRRRPL